MGDYWTPDDLAGGGPGNWHYRQDDPYDGDNELFCGLDTGDSYGNFELDALVSRRIDLTDVENPTLVFYHHYNIQAGNKNYDRGWVFVTTDYGESFTPATLRAGGEAMFTGYLPHYTKVEIDLGDFAGQQLHIVYSFESGKANAGEEDGQPAGWWVDDLSIATNYSMHPPAIGSVSVSPYSLYGSLPEETLINVSVFNSDNVDTMRFVLDCVPLGSFELYDIEFETDLEPYVARLDVPTNVPNQLANLQVQYFNDHGEAGQPRNIPVYIFNQLGDTNADGVVDDADLEGYAAQLGLTSADAGFIPFYDSDLDGVVSEKDANVVGYYYGAGTE